MSGINKVTQEIFKSINVPISRHALNTCILSFNKLGMSAQTHIHFATIVQHEMKGKRVIQNQHTCGLTISTIRRL